MADRFLALLREDVMMSLLLGAVGLGAASVLGTSMTSAAPLLQASKITVLVNSGDGDRVRNVAADYTKSSGTTVEVLELPYDQSFLRD